MSWYMVQLLVTITIYYITITITITTLLPATSNDEVVGRLTS